MTDYQIGELGVPKAIGVSYPKCNVDQLRQAAFRRSSGLDIRWRAVRHFRGAEQARSNAAHCYETANRLMKRSVNERRHWCRDRLSRGCPVRRRCFLPAPAYSPIRILRGLTVRQRYRLPPPRQTVKARRTTTRGYSEPG